MKQTRTSIPSRTRLGRQQRFGNGQGAFDTRNGSVVIRKDYEVLLIDVRAPPAQFGNPSTSRESVAVNIATVITACWSAHSCPQPPIRLLAGNCASWQ